jgi:hypothetical protein
MMLHHPMILAMGVGLLGVGAASASAFQAPPAATPVAQATTVQKVPSTKKDSSRRVCRSIVHSGTRMASRYCRTREEWDSDAERARRFLEDGQHNARRDGEMNGLGMEAPPPR